MSQPSTRSSSGEAGPEAVRYPTFGSCRPARTILPRNAKAAEVPGAETPHALLIGDVMTDVIVHPEGPLARGTDRRAKIRFEPGGSAANQATWLAAFGVAVDFVARVGL